MPFKGRITCISWLAFSLALPIHLQAEKYDTVLIKEEWARIIELRKISPKHDSIRIMLQQIIDHSLQSEDPKFIAKSYYMNGQLLMNFNEYKKSKENLIHALHFYQKINDSSGVGMVYMQLGLLNYLQKYYVDAATLFEKAEQNLRKINKIHEASICTYLIALCDLEIKNYEQAIVKFNQAITYFEEKNVAQSLNESRVGLGDAYLRTGQYNLALSNFQKAHAYFSVSDNPEAVAITMLFLGNVYFKKEQLDSAKYFLSKADSILFNLKFSDYSARAAKSMQELFEHTGDFEKAYFYQNRYYTIKDSLYTRESAEAIAGLKFELEVARQENEIVQLNQKRENDKKLQYFLLFTSLAIIALLILLWQRYRLKQAVNTTLTAKNEELNEALENLKSAEEQLVHSEKLASLGQLTAGIAHEIKNPLNFINNFSSLSADLAEALAHTGDEEERQEISADLKSNMYTIQKHGDRINSIVNSMMQHAHQGKQEKVLTDCNRLVEDTTSLAYHGYKALHPDWPCHPKLILDSSLPKTEVIPQDISRVILNLLQNAFYAASDRREKGKENYVMEVVVETTYSPDSIFIRVKDNACSVPQEVRQMIFNPFFTTKPPGKGTGLGLSISYDIMKAHGGNLILEEENGEYTVFCMVLPLVNPN